MKINLVLRTFSYPTEDLGKVKKALLNLGLKDSEIRPLEVEEAFGLPMYIIEVKRQDKKAIELLKNIYENLDRKERFFSFLESTYDEASHTSALRIDKQTLYKDKKIKLTPYGDVVHIKIKYVFPNNLEDFKKEFTKLLQERTNR